MTQQRNNQDFQGQAAILVALAGLRENRKILLTKRAEHLTIHRGEVAFPGGKWEVGDENLLVTALRESHEEVALHPRHVTVVGELDCCFTRAGMAVTPFVGELPLGLALEANKSELDAIFWVPVDFFLSDVRECTHIFRIGAQEEWAPVYSYEGFKIWGFTAKVIVNFLNTFCEADIQRTNLAPERVFHKR